MTDVIRLINYAQQRLADIQEDYPDIKKINWHAVAEDLEDLENYLEKKLLAYTYDDNRRWRIGLALLESAVLNLNQAVNRYRGYPSLGNESWDHVDKVKKRFKESRHNFGRANAK